MHMISNKDLSDAEMDILTTSRSPTTVITANGEVQTHEEATVYVKELDICLTESPWEHASSITVRKAFRWKRLFFVRVDQRSKTTSHSKRYSDAVQHGKLRSDRGSRLVIEFFIQFSSFNLNDTFKTGEQLSYIFFKLVFITNYNSIKWQCGSRKGRSEWDRFPSSACVKLECWRDDRTGRPVVCC